ncbi:MAG: chitobiase/beta-hexosaminidase C-terminal domain-containing protein, partial [Paramuribaculum sp.]|nr:chitobiase/beta-hexosaminidase C-terminal domain-containing protein [Paramuribaculum sp.]
MNSNTCYIARIEVRWNPKKPEPPKEAPVLTKKASNITEWLEPDAEAGRDYYQATIYNMPNTEFATPVTERAEKYYWTLADETTLPVTNAVPESGVTSTAAKDAKTKWISSAIAPYAGAPVNNTVSAFGDSYSFNVRVKGYNPSGTSDESKLKVVINRLPAPEIDVEKTTAIEGQTWNEATKTLTYTSNTPQIHLKCTTGTNIESYYRFGPGAVSASDSKVSASNIVSPNLWEEGMPDIADGYTTKLQAFSQTTTYVANSQGSMSTTYTDVLKKKGTPYYIFLTKKGEAKGVLEAPEVEVDNAAGTAVTGTGIVSFIGNNVGVTAKSTMQTENPQFEYQFIEPVNGIWSQTPAEGKWTPWPEGGYKVTSTGRLFVRETDGKSTPNHTSRDFEKITTKDATLALDGVADEDLVTLTEPLRIVGAYHTVVPNSNQQTTTRFVYVTDAQGRAIKLRGEREEGLRVFPANYFNFADIEAGKVLTVPARGITGVVRGIESGLPELWVTTAAMDYTAFLSEAETSEAAGWNTDLKEVNEVERSDFNRKVVLRGMTFDNSTNQFTSSTGRTVKTYGRLLTAPEYSDIINTLCNGVRYTLEGFVGYAEGEIVVLPTGAVKVPSLRAPNSITANETDIANGYITVNVISDNFTVYPDATGVRQGTECRYTVNGVEKTPVSMTGDNPVIKITAEDFADEVCDLSVRYVRNNIASQPVRVKFVHHQAEAMASIAEFKEAYLGNDNLPDPEDAAQADAVEYHRYTGSAQVRAITPHYLYLRDLQPEDADAPYTTAEKSAHSLLLYNANGWEAPVAMADRAGESPRRLEVGDIITNFALIADRTELGNLRGYATGFSRTVQLLNAQPATPEEIQGEEWQPVEKDALADDLAGFTESDRMVRYRVNNVLVSRTDGNMSAANDDTDRYVYTLEIPGKPTLNINQVFEMSQGWGTVYDSQTRYDIEGVVLRNGEDESGNPKYALAFIDFSIKNVTAPAAPVLTLSGDGVEGSQFVTEATLTMSLPEGVDAQKATIWYTTDGTDPMQASSTRKAYDNPITVKTNTIVKAFIAVTGGLPGAMAEQIYTRRANDRRYIVNFLDQAEEGVPYHFTGTARVAAKGGEYVFVRGTQGHYLPIHIDAETGIDPEQEKVGNYVSDFIVEANIINTENNRIVRGANITAEYAPFFSASSETRPAELDKDIEFEPDVVTVITPANARRFVKITGVRLTGSAFESEDGIDNHDTEWKLTTEKGAGIDIPVNHNILQPSFNWDETDQSAAAYYNITGFAMLDEQGQIELWPLEVEKVKSSEPVVPSFTGNITVDPVTADGITTVEFYPSTTVRLHCPIADPESATIYYYVSADGSKPGSDAKWNVYAQPFAVTSDCYITMYATAEGYEQSAPTYIDMKLGKPAGTVAFGVKAESGKTTVTMTAAEGAEIFWTADATKPMEQWTRYEVPVEFTEAANISAYAREGKKNGAVSSMYVMVVEMPETPENPKERISGRVKFDIDDSQPGKVIVHITPEAEIAGEYEIYYTTTPGITLTPATGTL